MMNSGNQLLLRFFKSEFFNAWIAVSYLFKYPDAVGIQHYLCNELKKFPLDEIEFFLPQLVHLLISRPSESVALENFILDRCHTSSHIAILTLWYLQAYTSDLASTPNTPSFKLCKRVFNKVQAIVFATESPDENDDHLNRNGVPKVKENIFSAMVGMGVMLAAVGQPLMSKNSGQLAIAQGRRPRAFSQSGILDGHDDDAQDHTTSASTPKISTSTSPLPPLPLTPQPQPQPQLQQQPSPSLHNVTSTTATTATAASVAAIAVSPQASGRSTPSGKQDPMTGRDSPLASPIISAGAMASLQRGHMTSSPSLEDLRAGHAFKLKREHFTTAASRRSHDTIASSSPVSVAHSDRDSLEGGLSSSASSQIARRSYFHSEMQFLLALEDIATRLVIVPKPARLSALRAELTLLNHNLPAEICIPLWCRATIENPHHHRVVRIPPQDAVVLNSADRVPYLLQVEVLETDMSVEEIRALRRDPLEDEEEDKEESEVSSAAEAGSSVQSESDDEQHASESEATTVTTSGAEMDKDGSISLENVLPKDSADESITTTTATSAAPKISVEESKDNGENGDDAASANGAERPVPSATEISTDSSMISPPGSPIPGRAKSPKPSSVVAAPHSKSNEAYMQTVMRRRASNSADDFAEKMRTAAVMLAQLNQQQANQLANANGNTRTSHQSRSSIKAKATSVEEIRARIIREMMALEEQRMQRMKVEGVSSGVGGGGGEGAGSEMLEDERKVMANVNTDDPSAAVFAEEWEDKMERIRRTSPYGHLPSWQLLSVIVKQGADLRQEQLACQLIREIGWIWERAEVDVWVTNMRILVTSDNSGLIETLRNTMSIHSIKKDAYARRLNQVGVVYTLYDYFQQKFGDPSSERYLKAQDNFMRSLAAYSVISYVLQIRDRHNGNILVDTDGHIIHIDFGFMLSNSPGSVGFEMAPFKLPQEYIDVLGGVGSDKFAEFKVLIKKAFMAVRKHTENIVLLIDMMSKDSKLPCFQYENAAQAVRDRLVLNMTEAQAEDFIDKLIISSCCNVFTRLYDTFQYYSNGIL
ncbi:Phosphatidylinositol 4-kinase pik1alpha (PI4-kinase)(PtdIns-4-kinase) [Actinomortierella ambigua]|uniref:1-phosphatidylinositol 4-kinase n=1 Tax=Actinomortierella ambigua TaxID=1343610 RepID=A0A9P6Q7L3_9FUNG|nr:Phosphatidylinositol 4-kinase pik1alpha (PI4-kinase)(PtdIns-4-kinase) [Actinomortierella ambigua]